MKSMPKPTKKDRPKKKKVKTNRQKLILEISDLCRKITTWRDGCTCVLCEVDGGRCNDVSQWGHVIPQGASGYLKHNLSNSFRQCGSHNTIHKTNQAIYLNWYEHKFGKRAFDMLTEASKKTYHKFTTPDLWEMRDEMKRLIDSEHLMLGTDIAGLVFEGYYGSIIREAWIKEGRI